MAFASAPSAARPPPNSPVSSPSQAPLTVRPYDHPKDFKFFRYLVGYSILAKAGPSNRLLFWSNPLVYFWWIAFTVRFGLGNFERLGLPSKGIFSTWWVGQAPHKDRLLEVVKDGVIGLPVFFLPLVALLLSYSWSSRNHFDRVLRETLFRPDLEDPVAYYDAKEPCPSSNKGTTNSIWVLDYEGRQLGFIAIDHRRNCSDVDNEDGTCWINHLACSTSFQSAGIDHDLLSHALSTIFAPSSAPPESQPTTNTVKINLIPQLDSHQLQLLKRLGFKLAADRSASSSPIAQCRSLTRQVRAWLGFPQCETIWAVKTFALSRSAWIKTQVDHQESSCANKTFG